MYLLALLTNSGLGDIMRHVVTGAKQRKKGLRIDYSKITFYVCCRVLQLFPRRSYQKHLVVIFHVHEIVVDCSREEDGLDSQVSTTYKSVLFSFYSNGVR